MSYYILERCCISSLYLTSGDVFFKGHINFLQHAKIHENKGNDVSAVQHTAQAHKYLPH